MPTDRGAVTLPDRTEERKAMLRKGAKPRRSTVVRMRDEERA
ncbi:MAG TPA: hypothetical protein VN634_20500 [Candidatus Limnocylindrales bacterium]|nr:hypothetical protein [Candidatus Limnocylindrales bacterium]